MKINEFEKIEQLTKALVKINSVNNSDGGESKVADYIYKYFSKHKYYKNNPDHLLTVDCENNRKSTIALLKGKTNKTIVLMGHIDTVEIEDYGKAKKYATNPDKLVEELKKHFSLSEEVLKDIESDKYMFGRGTLDMKAGVAAYMTVFEYFLNHLDELNGSLLLIAECDEEGDSKGVVSVLKVLNDLRDKENLEYKCLLNGDYSVSYDNNRYIYLGTVGKILPSFLAFGKETHAGDSFGGLDPNFLLSVLNKNISYNFDLCDEYKGKTTVPPINLKQADFKETYTVQSNGAAVSYFNYMLYTSTPKDVLKKCKKIAKDSFKEALSILNNNYKKYCKQNGIEYKRLYEPLVYTFEEFDELLSANPNYRKEINRYAKDLVSNNPNIDIREYSYKVVTKAYEYYDLKKPVIIVYFGSTFYSNIITEDTKLINSINESIETVNKESNYDISTSYFYPYISDMSFMCMKQNKKDIDNMFNNCPYYGYRYDNLSELISSINIPVVNIGTYGYDGHKYTERLEKEWSFKEMPNILYHTIINYLRED
ncbi:MAG: M20/M25/M40 family metallo-hydrolase [Erysipelotrichaceae bacterium]|nr:M20/M25/M40 family metallo-hydrolase [Erysipelotrichaceae bacterium]